MNFINSFLKTFPLKSALVFLAGVFFTFSIIAFAVDIMNMGTQPPLRFALSVVVAGTFSVLYAAAGFLLRKQSWKAFIPIFILHGLANILVGRLPGGGPLPSELNAAEIARLQDRLNFDGYATMLVMALGYTCFVYIAVTEGRRYSRMHAEIELASEIHHVLVPAIDVKLGNFEFYGRSSASGEVGGDLIDVAGREDHWAAYVADVSGHGVAPGVVMGMVKSATRMLLGSENGTQVLLPRLNEVLFPLKNPDMFVTFCFLARNEDGLRVGLAGHPAMLQFSAETGEVFQIESPNMPLGILPIAEFADQDIPSGEGDVFALYTDGFLETANTAGEEFGLQRLQAEFQKHGREPLAAICHSLFESVARHGAQFDDRSILLIRRL